MDGYVSAAAGNGGGEFVTPPLRYDGSRLELNVNTSAGGHVEVGLALLEKEGPAFAPSTQDLPAEACDRMVCNSVRRTVTWNGKHDISHLAGKLVRMHVRMRNAKLYAFQFAGDE